MRTIRQPIQTCFFYLRPIFFSIISMLNVGQMLSQTPSPEDVTRIKKLVDDYANARQENNEDQIRLLFTLDADQLVSSGEWRYGIDALVAGMMSSSQSNPGERTLTVEKVRSLGKETAIADARYEIKGSQGTPDRKMWSTFILVKEYSRWKIAAIRNMLPAQSR